MWKLDTDARALMGLTYLTLLLMTRVVVFDPLEWLSGCLVGRERDGFRLVSLVRR
jgi:hypothetical protein